MTVRSLCILVLALATTLLVAPVASAAPSDVGIAVTNGTIVTRDRYDSTWRSIVSLQSSWYGTLRGSQQGSHSCGGVLVRPTIVLTAAHCADRGFSSSSMRAHGATRRLSKNPKRVFGASVKVIETIAHPGYSSSYSSSGSSAGFDLALMRLEAPIPGSTPIAIVAPSEDAAWGAGTGRASGAFIAGWGFTRGYRWSDDDDYSARPRDLVSALVRQLEDEADEDAAVSKTPRLLREVGLPIVPDRRCASSDSPMGEEAPEFDRRSMLCVGITDTKQGDEDDRIGACFGDSGGPLLAPVADGSMRLVGIASWGRDSSCGGLTVYARVASARTWIDATIAELDIAPSTTITGPITGVVVDDDTLRMSWPAVSGPYERLTLLEERSAWDEYMTGPYAISFGSIGPRARRVLQTAIVRRTHGITGEGSTALTINDMAPRPARSSRGTFRLVATLASGRRVYGPRSKVELRIDDTPPSAPGLVRRIGDFQGVGLLRWRPATDDECVAGYLLEVRWPGWKPGVWELQHGEATRGCGGAEEGDSWFELPPNQSPTFDLRRGTWLARAVAFDLAGNRGVGPISRIRIPAYVEDLGLDSECRIVGPNVVCTYPKDEY